MSVNISAMFHCKTKVKCRWVNMEESGVGCWLVNELLILIRSFWYFQKAMLYQMSPVLFITCTEYGKIGIRVVSSTILWHAVGLLLKHLWTTAWSILFGEHNNLCVFHISYTILTYRTVAVSIQNSHTGTEVKARDRPVHAVVAITCNTGVQRCPICQFFLFEL